MRLKDRIRKLYTIYPELISSDKRLTLAQWEREGFFLTDEQKRKFMDVTSSDSITRAGRTLREKEGFKATPEVEQARYEKFEEAHYSGGESIVDEPVPEMPQFEGTMEQLNQLTILGE